MAKMGRPQKEINKEQFEKLCAMLCKPNEIIDFLDVSRDTLERWVKREYRLTFAAVVEQKASGGKISLRRAMLQSALSGNVTAQIWLSKQYLGMTDKIETEQAPSEIKVSISKYVPPTNTGT